MNIYQDLYHLIEVYIYDGNLEGFNELVCTLVATCGCLFLIALPFMIVWKVVKLILDL